MAERKPGIKLTLREIGFSIFGIALGLYLGKYFNFLVDNFLLVLIIALLVLAISSKD
jgi:hypothetical protein